MADGLEEKNKRRKEEKKVTDNESRGCLAVVSIHRVGKGMVKVKVDVPQSLKSIILTQNTPVDCYINILKTISVDPVSAHSLLSRSVVPKLGQNFIN